MLPKCCNNFYDSQAHKTWHKNHRFEILSVHHIRSWKDVYLRPKNITHLVITVSAALCSIKRAKNSNGNKNIIKKPKCTHPQSEPICEFYCTQSWFSKLSMWFFFFLLWSASGACSKARESRNIFVASSHLTHWCWHADRQQRKPPFSAVHRHHLNQLWHIWPSFPSIPCNAHPLLSFATLSPNIPTAPHLRQGK